MFFKKRDKEKRLGISVVRHHDIQRIIKKYIENVECIK